MKAKIINNLKLSAEQMEVITVGMRDYALVTFVNRGPGTVWISYGKPAEIDGQNSMDLLENEWRTDSLGAFPELDIHILAEESTRIVINIGVMS